MEYKDYSPEELAMDDYFMRWVNHPDEETNAYWETWLKKHPEKKPQVEEAIELIRLFNREKVGYPESDYWDVWQRLQQSQMSKRPIAKGYWYKVAAVIIGLLLVGVGVFYMNYYQQKVYYATDYGQKETFVLPDSSRVTLNANSRLTYKKPGSGNFITNMFTNLRKVWVGKDNLQGENNAPAREVWLRGEAYFQVKEHANSIKGNGADNPVKFIVHTENLDVEVIGTAFNVNDRKGSTQVVLNSGKIRLNFKSFNNKNRSELTMEPGQLVEYQKENHAITSREVNPSQFSAWKENMLVFDGTTIEEIADILERNYGFEVTIKDKELLQKQFQGRISSEDVDILLQGLSKAFDIQVQKEGNKVLITGKE